MKEGATATPHSIEQSPKAELRAFLAMVSNLPFQLLGFSISFISLFFFCRPHHTIEGRQQQQQGQLQRRSTARRSQIIYNNRNWSLLRKPNRQPRAGRSEVMPDPTTRKLEDLVTNVTEPLVPQITQRCDEIMAEFQDQKDGTDLSQEDKASVQAMALKDPEILALERKLVERRKRKFADETSSTESWDEVATPTSGSVRSDIQQTDHSGIDKRAKDNEKRAHKILEEAKNVPAAFASASPSLQAVEKHSVFDMGRASGPVSFEADLASLKAAQAAHSTTTDQAAVAAENAIRARMLRRVSTSNFTAYFFDSCGEGAQDVKLAFSTKNVRYLTRPTIRLCAWLIAYFVFSYTVKYTFKLLTGTSGTAIAAVLGPFIGSIETSSIINSPFPLIKNTGYILNNYATLSNNMGTIVNNFAPIMNNNGTVVNNFDNIKVNFGVVENNFEHLHVNFGEVCDNYRRITRNFGTVGGAWFIRGCGTAASTVYNYRM